MCYKDATDIRMPKRDYENNLLGPPIIKLEFEKYILDPHIIMEGENIQLQMKKERPTLCERCLQFGHPKNYCRSDRELCINCVKLLQEGRMHNCRGTFTSTAKKLHKTGDKKICKEYKMEAAIQNKMRLNKCDVYTAKETLGYKGRKSYMRAARGAEERDKNKGGQKKIQAYR